MPTRHDNETTECTKWEDVVSRQSYPIPNLLWFHLSFDGSADWETLFCAFAVLVLALLGVPALLAALLLPGRVVCQPPSVARW